MQMAFKTDSWKNRAEDTSADTPDLFQHGLEQGPNALYEEAWRFALFLENFSLFSPVASPDSMREVVGRGQLK